nr:hypothetical protein [Tanacetum cinerariifolium]
MAGDDVAKNKNEGESIDHNSPFHLHASDYLKQMHVNEVLTDKNYSDWEQEMMNFLFAKNKTGFIDGTIEKPEVESDRYLPWMRCNAMIKGFRSCASLSQTEASQSRQSTKKVFQNIFVNSLPGTSLIHKESHHRWFPFITSLIQNGSHMSPTKSLFDVGSRRIFIFIVITYVSLECSGNTIRIIRRTLKILLVITMCDEKA